MADADCTRACRFCGVRFVREAKGFPTQYCSFHCRDEKRREYERNRPNFSAIKRRAATCTIDECDEVQQCKGLCSKHYYRLRAHGDPLVTKHGRLVEKPCGWCGKVMSLKPGVAAVKVCCSRSCRGKLTVKRKGQDFRSAIAVACHGCGITAKRKVKKDDAGRYCSRKCNTDTMARVAAERKALERIRSAWEWKQSPRVADEVAALRRIARYVERPRKRMAECRECARPMIWTIKAGGCQRVCDGCQLAKRKAARKAWLASDAGRRMRRRHKSARRAVERGLAADKIDPIAVFERDKWTCQLCGKRTPRRLRGKVDADAPELDHIIALAIGGTHTWGNVQCACRACNAAKGATAVGQLGLPLAC